MKVDVFFNNDELAISFKRSDVKTDEDIRALSEILNRMYLKYDRDITPTKEQIEALLEKEEKNIISIGIVKINGDGRACLVDKKNTRKKKEVVEQ